MIPYTATTYYYKYFFALFEILEDGVVFGLFLLIDLFSVEASNSIIVPIWLDSTNFDAFILLTTVELLERLGILFFKDH